MVAAVWHATVQKKESPVHVVTSRICTGVAGRVGFSLGFKLKALRRMASVARPLPEHVQERGTFARVSGWMVLALTCA